MQTIQKRKQWVVIALTMIATLTLQLFVPITARAEETERTLEAQYSVTLPKIQGSREAFEMMYRHNVTLSGVGNFVVHSARKSYLDESSGYYTRISSIYICSDKSFTANLNESTYSDGKLSSSSEYELNVVTINDIYVATIGVTTGKGLISDIYLNAPNQHTIPSDYDGSYIDELIASGAIDLSKDDYKELVFDESTAICDTSIPTPNITVKNDYSFGFNNDSDGYYFQVKGRWYSVDDIELYKENLMWKYKYSSYIKSNLTDWVATSEKASTSMQDLNFATFGKSAFDSFLSYYPVDSRSYTGGTNALGNYFSGYNDAVDTIKMLLKAPESIYNGLEIYIRYYTFDENGVAHYGKWCHYYDNLANASGSSGSQWDDKENMFTGNQSQDGLTDSQLGELENTENSRNDIDVVPEYNDEGFNSVILGNIDSSSLVTALESMYGQTKTFINMIGTVFNFLPSWIITLICVSLGLVCIIGVWKCIRG